MYEPEQPGLPGSGSGSLHVTPGSATSGSLSVERFLLTRANANRSWRLSSHLSQHADKQVARSKSSLVRTGPITIVRILRLKMVPARLLLKFHGWIVIG